MPCQRPPTVPSELELAEKRELRYDGAPSILSEQALQEAFYTGAIAAVQLTACRIKGRAARDDERFLTDAH
jgi:hypothetical protein